MQLLACELTVAWVRFLIEPGWPDAPRLNDGVRLAPEPGWPAAQG